ncbi:MAG: hypothetical protein NTZ07_04380 [Candidatus Woesebacteria bacterium]|nr:hypothetical protein [Candidatus Woesebacteria bacterium]
MKELPIPFEENWFGMEGKASTRLLYEIKHMKKFFKLQEWKKITPPKTDWDCRNFYINTWVLRLHPVKDKAYPLGWDIQFSMDDGDRLCKKDQVWTIKIFYPKDYLKSDSPPLPSLIDNNGHALYGDKNKGTVSIDGKNYLHCCLYDKHKFNPGTEHAAIYASRSILWLRSCLDSKENGGSMKNYVSRNYSN